MSLSPATGGGDLRRRPGLRSTGASIGFALAGIVTLGNHLIGDGGRPIAAFARRAGIPPPRRALAGQKPTPEATPHLHINNVNAYHSRSGRNGSAASNGVAAKNLPN